jgi:hypothetical protein
MVQKCPWILLANLLNCFDADLVHFFLSQKRQQLPLHLIGFLATFARSDLEYGLGRYPLVSVSMPLQRLHRINQIQVLTFDFVRKLTHNWLT